jgi:hypothetical protein
MPQGVERRSKRTAALVVDSDSVFDIRYVADIKGAIGTAKDVDEE